MDMKITPINNNTTSKPAFRSCYRIYSPHLYEKYDVFQKEIVRSSTNLFRNDLNWNQLILYIDAHFADKNVINTYSLACSDGSEAFSYAISVMENLPKEVHKKFLPIIASDIDTEALKAATSGRINLYAIEFLATEKEFGIDISKYLKDKNVSIEIFGDPISETDEISSYKFTDNILDSVKFKRSDILTELKNINDNGNSVVMCRNVFPYLKTAYVNEVIATANKQLKDGSLFIIGDYDRAEYLGNRLLENNFFKPLLNNENIYMKGSLYKSSKANSYLFNSL